MHVKYVLCMYIFLISFTGDLDPGAEEGVTETVRWSCLCYYCLYSYRKIAIEFGFNDDNVDFDDDDDDEAKCYFFVFYWLLFS